MFLRAADEAHQAVLKIQAEAERASARADPGQHERLAIQAQKGRSEAAPEGVRYLLYSPIALTIVGSDGSHCPGMSCNIVCTTRCCNISVNHIAHVAWKIPLHYSLWSQQRQRSLRMYIRNIRNRRAAPVLIACTHQKVLSSPIASKLKAHPSTWHAAG